MAEKIGSLSQNGTLEFDAINGRRRRDDDFFHARFARGFEEVDRAFDVDALVKRRLFEARTHAGARGEMDDLVKFDGGKNFRERGGVADVAVEEFKRLGERLDVRGDCARLRCGS